MTRSGLAAILVGAIVVGIPGCTQVSAQEASSLAGRWTLNRASSQFPREVGFGADLMAGEVSDADSTGSGGRGRGGSGGGGATGLLSRRESEDDVKRARQLTDEVQNPSPHLTIVETPTSVTITDDRGHSRTFHADGKEEVLQLDDVPVAATARREGNRLVVVYQVEQGRELRYTYASTSNPPQLIIDVQFVERGGRGSIRRVYQRASLTEVPPPAAATTPPLATQRPGTDVPPGGGGSNAGKPAVPAPPLGQLPPGTVVQQPDANLKGLTKLLVVVEDLGPQATACGLKQAAIETAVSKSLTDAGLKVLRNSDEDTYVYVDVVTGTLSSGLCVSRYDVFLYTNTTARLSYGDAVVPVQVSLLHEGGIAGGASAAHAEAVLRGVKQYVDQFAARIRSANK